MKCPDCDHVFTVQELRRRLTDDEMHSLKASYASTKRTRKVGGHGGGRPRATERCPCGKYSARTASLRRHVCEAPPRDPAHEDVHE